MKAISNIFISQLVLLLSILMMLSCNSKKKSSDDIHNKATTNGSFIPSKVTMIADLPDSLKPFTVSLDTMPKSEVIKVGISETNQLLVSNEEKTIIGKSKKVIDKNGNINEHFPKIIGKPNIFNFTKDDGLIPGAIFHSLLDKKGHLWFGGIGLSRYDGKSFTNFTSEHGINDDVIYCITEDKRGYLWIGTNKGVCRYDGNSFTDYSKIIGVNESSVFSICEDREGIMWFGTGSCLIRFDGTSTVKLSPDEGRPIQTVWCILEDKQGLIWCGDDNGLSNYDGKYFRRIYTDSGKRESVSRIFEDKAGNIWINSSRHLCRYDGKVFIPIREFDGLNISCFLEDRNGIIWFGIYESGLCRYDGNSLAILNTKHGLNGDNVWCISEDANGHLWIGTDEGISRYEGTAFQSYNHDDGLANWRVTGMTEDNVGNLWFGTYGGGISRYNHHSFTNVNLKYGLSGLEPIISPDSTVFTSPKNNRNYVVHLTKDKKGQLWFGTNRGEIINYDGITFTVYGRRHGLNKTEFINFSDIYADQKGNIWIGTYDGIYRFYQNKITYYSTKQGLAGNYINCIEEDHAGNLWFGTNQGLTCFDGHSFANYSTNQGLLSNNILCAFKDNSHNLWFGTPKGLCVILRQQSYDNKTVNNSNSVSNKNQNRTLKYFNESEYFQRIVALSIKQLSNGKMVIMGYNEIVIFDVNSDYTSLSNFELYNYKNGHKLKDLVSMYVDSKGTIWAGTESPGTGLVSFNYEDLHNNKKPPPLIITAIKVNEGKICWYDIRSNGVRRNKRDSTTTSLQEHLAYGKSLSNAERDSIVKYFKSIDYDSIKPDYPIPTNLVLPYDFNKISFEYCAIEHSRPFLIKYQYMLEGNDKDWSPITDKNSAQFGSLREGNYTFKIKALGTNGIWTKPISYTFKVLPPWYRSWWVYFLYVGTTIGLIFLYIKWRERKLIEQKTKLEQIVVLRTEELVVEKTEANRQRDEAEKQRQRSDELLLNILPEEVAEELKAKGSADAKQYDEVTVLFTDFKDFTQISEKMSPTELVDELNTFFKAFDEIITSHGIEKIKTIGDSYMCVGGLPTASPSHAEDVIYAGLEIQEFVEKHSQVRVAQGKEPLLIRIGIHSGPVIAGIVGVKKYAYDIWGDTVNTASRMESSGEAGRVNISETTYELVKDKFRFISRGKIMAKHKGEMEMYFVEGRM